MSLVLVCCKLHINNRRLKVCWLCHFIKHSLFFTLRVDTLNFILRPEDGPRAAKEVPRGRLWEASSVVAGKSCLLCSLITLPAWKSSYLLLFITRAKLSIAFIKHILIKQRIPQWNKCMYVMSAPYHWTHPALCVWLGPPGPGGHTDLPEPQPAGPGQTLRGGPATEHRWADSGKELMVVMSR